MCGTVSFKRGDSFYRAGKVSFDYYSPIRCEATVKGTEDFYVTINTDEGGNLRTACSCPKLASVKTECQHIAAVLLALYEHQQQGTTPIVANGRQIDSATKQELTKGLLTIFTNQPKRSSGHQLHFENRQVLGVEFLCKPVEIQKGIELLGIQMEIDHVKVNNIRDFLSRVKEGNSSILADTFTFNPNQHCFLKETDDVIQLLSLVLQDEKAYFSTISDTLENTFTSDQLLIPPTSWEQLLSLLVIA